MFTGNGTSVRRLSRPARAGVSLLEVMFSIGVVMIGLVGIAALIPVAGSQARKGLVANSAANLGQSAVRDFHVRGMARPSTWRWYDQTKSAFDYVTLTDPLTNGPSEILPLGLSYCVDPRFVGAGTPPDYVATAYFPMVGFTRMKRVTLANALNDQLVAEQLFVAGDDMAFELPRDRTLGPVQSFPIDSATRPVRRNVDGTLSWMATVVPKLDLSSTPKLTRQYILSIVVFHRRVMNRQLTPEMSFDVQFPLILPAFSGGDVVLTFAGNDPGLRIGDWILVSDRVTGNVHRWYRLASIDEAEGTGTPRYATLVGPDWDYGAQAQGTFVRGVAAVFEKTIHLETSSLWTY